VGHAQCLIKVILGTPTKRRQSPLKPWWKQTESYILRYSPLCCAMVFYVYCQWSMDPEIWSEHLFFYDILPTAPGPMV
jgi:hypothetical protein